jgi:hypothetical protein
MSRRDTGEHDTARDDHQMTNAPNIGIEEQRYLRLRCLELAVRMHDPDGAVSLGSAEETADYLLRYVSTGSMAKPE